MSAAQADNSTDPDRYCKEGGRHDWQRGRDAKNERVYICAKCRCWILGEPSGTEEAVSERKPPITPNWRACPHNPDRPCLLVLCVGGCQDARTEGADPHAIVDRVVDPQRTNTAESDA